MYWHGSSKKKLATSAKDADSFNTPFKLSELTLTTVQRIIPNAYIVGPTLGFHEGVCEVADMQW